MRYLLLHEHNTGVCGATIITRAQLQGSTDTYWATTLEPVYRRAQSEEYVVPPIPMHMPPLLPGLLTHILEHNHRGMWYHRYVLHLQPVYPRAQSQGYMLPPIPMLHWEPVYPGAQSQGYVVIIITTIITWVTYCYIENQYILEHNHRSMWCHRSLCRYHHYYRGYLLLQCEPVYPRAQSQEYVVAPIPMHAPPLLHGLLTVTLGTSIS